MNLPIDIYSDRPLMFVWRQITTTPLGDRTVEYAGVLGQTVDGAVADLIRIAKQLDRENIELKARIDRQLNDPPTLPAHPTQQEVDARMTKRPRAK